MASSDLTAREKQICQLLWMSNKDIALSLGTAPKTVENQITGILDKLGCHGNRILAAYKCFALGIIVCPDPQYPATKIDA
jgi:DNA-binding NarL/FixJ family response regulator